MATRSDNHRTGARPPIADVLREAIRQGMLAPGQPLIQASIADAMGVSRIPVREALHALAAEGLVTFGEDGGARVTALEPEEVEELWTLRALLESQMAPGMVRVATDSDIEMLRGLVEQMDDVAEMLLDVLGFDVVSYDEATGEIVAKLILAYE